MLSTASWLCIQPSSLCLLHAGYETTSTAIAYALYELARNPAVQSKLQAEVDAFGQNREPSFDELSSFPYAEAVFLEGMRLHPPVTPFIALVTPLVIPSFAAMHLLPASYCTRTRSTCSYGYHESVSMPEVTCWDCF